MSNTKESSGLYLSRIKTHAPQNNFHKEVLAASVKYDRILITDPEAFITDLKKWIEKTHIKHPRAKAMQFEIYRRTISEDPYFNIGGVLFFTLFLVKGKHSADGLAPYLPFVKGGDDHGA
jgi:hypothetical protein